MNYESKTSEQIKQIALDYMAGRLFCSDQVQNINDMPMVFMVLLFLPEEDLKDLREGKITFAYEYMDQASPRSINGMPMFYSAKFLDHEDRKRMYGGEAESSSQRSGGRRDELWIKWFELRKKGQLDTESLRSTTTI
jgi:hypothetical protein